jgi:hypothetical protein
MGILQTRIWLPQIPLSSFAPLCGTPKAGQRSGAGKSSGTRLENSSRITGNPEVIRSSVGLVLTNALVLSGLANFWINGNSELI